MRGDLTSTAAQPPLSIERPLHLPDARRNWSTTNEAWHPARVASPTEALATEAPAREALPTKHRPRGPPTEALPKRTGRKKWQLSRAHWRRPDERTGHRSQSLCGNPATDATAVSAEQLNPVVPTVYLSYYSRANSKSQTPDVSCKQRAAINEECGLNYLELDTWDQHNSLR